MSKYIAFNGDGTDINYGPDSIEGTARTMLTYDGFEYNIIEEGGEFKLFVSRFSRNGSGGTQGMAEWPAYAAVTEAGVYENVIRMGGVQSTYAISEVDYAAMLAEVE